VTRDLKHRVEDQQGYGPDEYDIIMKSDNIEYVSEQEIYLQKMYGYRVDETPYNELKFNTKEMNINITEATTTFPCPANKLKGQLMDNLGMNWETDHGNCTITNESIKWIMKNVQVSRYNEQRSYIYNKAFARWFENNNAYPRTGGLAPDCGPHERKCETTIASFDSIRAWANERGLYNGGDPKTQALKLTEEVGETCRAILKEDAHGMIDGIGDCVVVLTNLAELIGTPIEECIARAYDEIKDRTGKMDNGTFKKD
jgi:NTP pyrophosphatase (non-canonical NTP hydrolase)